MENGDSEGIRKAEKLPGGRREAGGGLWTKCVDTDRNEQGNKSVLCSMGTIWNKKQCSAGVGVGPPEWPEHKLWGHEGRQVPQTRCWINSCNYTLNIASMLLLILLLIHYWDSKREQASQMLHLGFPFHFSFKMGHMGTPDPRGEVRAPVSPAFNSHRSLPRSAQRRGRAAETEVEMRSSLGLFLWTSPNLFHKNQTHPNGVVRAQLTALSPCV